jgi:C4-type Zn-finger protein
MSEIKVGIKIEADGSKGQAVLTTLEGSLRQVGGSARRVTQDIGALHAGWARLNDQFSRQAAAKAWTDQLSQASA